MNENETIPNKKQPVLALDMGSGFVKASYGDRKVKFPSLYGYREPSRLDDDIMGRSVDEKRNRIIEAVGEKAIEMQAYPTAVVLRGVSEGMPLLEKPFKALVHESVKRLDMSEQDLSSVTVITGIPYGNRSQKEELRRLVKSAIKPARCLVVSQSIGTLVCEGRSDGIVISIGQGTTEIVCYRDLRAEFGRSLKNAVDFLLFDDTTDKLTYVDIKNCKISRARVCALADLISDELDDISKMIPRQSTGKPDVIVSGGGILVDGLYHELQHRVRNANLVISQDPVFSNVLGMSRLLEIVAEK